MKIDLHINKLHLFTGLPIKDDNSVNKKKLYFEIQFFLSIFVALVMMLLKL